MKSFILKKIACNIKNRLHSRQQLCRLRGELRTPCSLQVARLTVIGIGLRELFYQNSLLAIPCSTALQKMSIFENAVLVRESVLVYTQVCEANLLLNGRAILASRLTSV